MQNGVLSTTLISALRSMPAAAWLIDSGVPRKLNVPRMSMNAVRLMASSMAVRAAQVLHRRERVSCDAGFRRR